MLSVGGRCKRAGFGSEQIGSPGTIRGIVGLVATDAGGDAGFTISPVEVMRTSSVEVMSVSPVEVVGAAALEVVAISPVGDMLVSPVEFVLASPIGPRLSVGL